jgi:hypothetical protein
MSGEFERRSVTFEVTVEHFADDDKCASAVDPSETDIRLAVENGLRGDFDTGSIDVQRQ